MTTYTQFHRGIISILGETLLVTSVGCSTPLNKREKGGLIGGGALVGDQLQKQDRE